MTSILAIENDKFLDIIQSNGIKLKDCISILEILKEFPYKFVLLQENISLTLIYARIYSNGKKNEDLKILSKMLEKYFDYFSIADYDDLKMEIDSLINIEANNFDDILNNNSVFHYEIEKIGFNLDTNTGLRNISTIDDLKKVLLLFCKNSNDIGVFIDKINIILSSLVFDEDIITSIEGLNDGFDLRVNEIIYHLHCIQKEVPDILGINPHCGYREIGNRMSLDCSPERARGIKNAKLIKTINGIEINCELHTKMRTISHHPPDRIYFCPSLPDGIDGDMTGKIYIYKITKHV